MRAPPAAARRGADRSRGARPRPGRARRVRRARLAPGGAARASSHSTRGRGRTRPRSSAASTMSRPTRSRSACARCSPPASCSCSSRAQARREALRSMLLAPAGSDFPASLLRAHPRLTVICDAAAASALRGVADGDHVCVVLGHRDPGFSHEHRISRESLGRVQRAEWVAQRRPTRAAVLTGYTSTGGLSEAEQMRAAWRLPGVPPLLEVAGRNTAGNAACSLPIVLALGGIREVTVVTSAWHVRAPYMFAPWREHGLRVRFAVDWRGDWPRMLARELHEARAAAASAAKRSRLWRCRPHPDEPARRRTQPANSYSSNTNSPMPKVEFPRFSGHSWACGIESLILSSCECASRKAARLEPRRRSSRRPRRPNNRPWSPSTGRCRRHGPPGRRRATRIGPVDRWALIGAVALCGGPCGREQRSGSRAVRVPDLHDSFAGPSPKLRPSGCCDETDHR